MLPKWPLDRQGSHSSQSSENKLAIPSEDITPVTPVAMIARTKMVPSIIPMRYGRALRNPNAAPRLAKLIVAGPGLPMSGRAAAIIISVFPIILVLALKFSFDCRGIASCRRASS